MNLEMVEGKNEYDSKKVYTLYVNPENRHITGMVGFTVGVQQLNDGNNFLNYNIDNLTEDEYKEISRSINSNEAMTFLSEEDNRTIHCRRILIDLLDDTMVDVNNGMLLGLNNILKFNVRVVNEKLEDATDIEEIEIKNIKKGNNPISLNGEQAEKYKIFIKNSSILTCELMGEGVHTLKIKAKVPGVDYLWLTAYPQMLRMSSDEREKLKNWLKENAGQPT